VLVDRLWPRGLSRSDAALDEWCREVAPSTELRTWYGHDPARFEEFRRRYLAELEDPERVAALDRLRGRAGGAPLTLLTATRQVGLSAAAVVAEALGYGGALAREQPTAARDAPEDGGDPACWAGLLCPECGAVLDGTAHLPGCAATDAG